MFQIDQQTLSDLHAIDWMHGSLLMLFDSTCTLGGRDILYKMFLNPLVTKGAIVARQEAIRYLADTDIDKLFDKYMMDDLERYLALSKDLYSESKLIYFMDKLATNFLSLAYEKEQLLIQQSIKEIAQVIVALKAIFDTALQSGRPLGDIAAYAATFYAFAKHLDLTEIKSLAQGKATLHLHIKYDNQFRNIHQTDIYMLFKLCYSLDALRAVARLYVIKSLCFPVFTEKADSAMLLHMQGCYNLSLANPVKNDVAISSKQNIWFLTGANMTGKSTLLKTIGSCLYLAHMGFPVPADAMETSLFQGLITSINLGDNLGSGYSHFFNEVLRVKSVAQSIHQQGPMVILLDELFKGTNYQDAYEATSQLMASISTIQNSIFLVSSHITELGGVLKDHPRIALRYLETQIDADLNHGVKFTYQLATGINDIKLGMWFLEKERVFEAFKGL